MSIEVLTAGWPARVVDLGRPRARSLGVPVGGAADRRSIVLGNGLLGNPAGAAALEFALMGPRLRANVDAACVLFGAPVAATLDGQPLRAGTTFTWPAGAELQVAGTPRGVRAYLCIRGGLQVPEILGSRSGLDWVPAGAVLPCPPGSIHARYAPEIEPTFPDAVALRVLPGLQASWFAEDEFYSQEFKAGPAGNRMGVRLQGEPLTLPERELVSEPVAPGAVQVTRDGQCIVLGVDGQTIGGYPKVAHVLHADLDALGQLRPGDRVRFVKVTLEAAAAVNRRRDAELVAWHTRLVASLDGFMPARRLGPIRATT